MAKAPKFGSDADFSKHVAQPSSVAHDGADYFFSKGKFLTFSGGVADAGKPIKLNSDGRVDESVLYPNVFTHTFAIGSTSPVLYYGWSFTDLADPSSSATGTIYGHKSVIIQTPASLTYGVAALRGALYMAQHDGSGALGALQGIVAQAVIGDTAGTVTQGKGVWGSGVVYSSSSSVYGIQGDVTVWGGTLNLGVGIRAKVQVSSNDSIGKTVSVGVGEAMLISTASSGTATYSCAVTDKLIGIRIGQTFGVYSTVVDAAGIYIDTPTDTIHPTNYYGLYMGDQSGVGGTLNYAIYTAGGMVEHVGSISQVSGSGDDIVRMEHASPTYGVAVNAQSGGWSRWFGFLNNAGSVNLGGFGAYGDGDDVQQLWIGEAYNKSTIKAYNSGLVGGYVYFNPDITSGNPSYRFYGWDGGSSAKKYGQLQISTTGYFNISAEKDIRLRPGNHLTYVGDWSYAGIEQINIITATDQISALNMLEVSNSYGGGIRYAGASNVLQIGVFNSSSAFTSVLEIPRTATYVRLRNGVPLQFYDAGDSNYISLDVPALTANKAWYLPTGTDTNNYILTTNGSGQWSFRSQTFNTFFRAYLALEQANLTHNTWVKVMFSAESWDVGSDYDAVTNYRWTAPENGFYYLHSMVSLHDGAVGGLEYSIRFLENGSTLIAFSRKEINMAGSGATQDWILELSTCYYFTAGDYVEVWVKNNWAGSDTMDISGGNSVTYFEGYKFQHA